MLVRCPLGLGTCNMYQFNPVTTLPWQLWWDSLSLKPLRLWMKSFGVAIQIKPLWQNFCGLRYIYLFGFLLLKVWISGCWSLAVIKSERIKKKNKENDCFIKCKTRGAALYFYPGSKGPFLKHLGWNIRCSLFDNASEANYQGLGKKKLSGS